MSRLTWGLGAKTFEQGLDRGVLYFDGQAVPWNGLVSVNERTPNENNTDHYFDGNRIHISQDYSEFEASVAAYTYPDVLDASDISNRRFGFSYRTEQDDNYRIHLVYNVLFKASGQTWSTESSEVQPSLFAWDIYGSPEPIPNSRPASHLFMEAPKGSAVFDILEDVLYGSSQTDPELLNPFDLVELYEERLTLRVTHNSDGTYTASGPDDVVKLLPDGHFEIEAPTVFMMENGIFSVGSY